MGTATGEKLAEVTDFSFSTLSTGLTMGTPLESQSLAQLLPFSTLSTGLTMGTVLNGGLQVTLWPFSTLSTGLTMGTPGRQAGHD